MKKGERPILWAIRTDEITSRCAPKVTAPAPRSRRARAAKQPSATLLAQGQGQPTGDDQGTTDAGEGKEPQTLAPDPGPQFIKNYEQISENIKFYQSILVFTQWKKNSDEILADEIEVRLMSIYMAVLRIDGPWTMQD